MKTLKLLSIVLCTLALLSSQTGCRTKKSAPGINTAGVTNLDPALTDGMTNDGTGGIGLNANTPPLESFSSDPSIQSVYFAYDSSTLAAGEGAKVTAVTAYLQGKPGTFVLVEGHCDERGSNEYNMGLGERRALAIREALVSQGVDSNFIVTQSYGEEKPAAMGHDESSYSQNRRGEFKFSAGQ